jgi:hypothetical protein
MSRGSFFPASIIQVGLNCSLPNRNEQEIDTGCTGDPCQGSTERRFDTSLIQKVFEKQDTEKTQADLGKKDQPDQQEDSDSDEEKFPHFFQVPESFWLLLLDSYR